MFPCNRLTIQDTTIYSDANPESKVKVVVKKGKTLTISEVISKEVSNSEFLFGKTPAGWACLQQDFTDFVEIERCPICFDNADFSDTIEKTTWCCNKAIHHACLERQVKAGPSGKMLTFKHLACPGCMKCMSENVYSLPNSLQTIVREQVELKTRINYLKTRQDEQVSDEEKGGWAFFKCSACTKPFCGGKVSCAEEEDLDTKELVCPECQWQLGCKDHRCFEHGRKYAIFKCDSCCAPASWSCTSNHYCERCHNQAGQKKFYPCPGGDKCELGIPHPANCEASHMKKKMIGFVIGCEKCCDPSGAVAYEYDSCQDAFAPPQDGVESLFKYGPQPKEPVCPPCPKEIPAPMPAIIEEPELAPIPAIIEEEEESSSPMARSLFGDSEEDSSDYDEFDEPAGNIGAEELQFELEEDDSLEFSGDNLDLKGGFLFKEAPKIDNENIDLAGAFLFKDSSDEESLSDELDDKLLDLKEHEPYLRLEFMAPPAMVKSAS